MNRIVATKHRLAALDRVRGIAMVLMASDHASGAFNAARPLGDGMHLPGANEPLVAVEFLFRWLSHFCAPAFLFLAGTSLALSVERKRAHGVRGIDRDLFVRGLLILGVELAFINYYWMPGGLLLQVMFAIGLSMIAMIALRHLPDALLIAGGLAVLLAGEWTLQPTFLVPSEPLAIAGALTLWAGFLQTPFLAWEVVLCAYPLLPWCAVMAFGWVFGRYLVRQRATGTEAVAPVRTCVALGLSLLLLFAVVRGVNGFGNLGLFRADGSLSQWLHVSKYPPSLAFVALELGLLFLVLGALFRADRHGEASANGPLLVFGQTALFFYLAHILLLEEAAKVTGFHMQATLMHAVVACVLVLLVLYPVCRRYRTLKAAHSSSLLRYL